MVAISSFFIGVLAATVPFTAAYVPNPRDTSLSLLVVASSISSTSAYAISSLYERVPKRGSEAAGALVALADKAKKNKGKTASAANSTTEASSDCADAAANTTTAATNATTDATCNSTTAAANTTTAAANTTTAASNTTSAAGTTTTGTTGKKNGNGKGNTHKNGNNGDTVTITESSNSIEILGKRETGHFSKRESRVKIAGSLARRLKDIGFAG